jgi:N-acetyl-alpha-D-muramate 1-phosphate uridylyltransferase
MKAMILAAGLGTRLKPFTDLHPKALYEIEGCTLLEHAVNHLKTAGINDVIINVHHFADQIIAYIHLHDNFGLNIAVSDESGELLETGGGLKKASWFFDNCDGAIIRNVDILSDLDLLKMARAHMDSGSLATLAVRNRLTSRYFLFDDRMKLCGWENQATGERLLTRETATCTPFAFSGIQILDPRVLQSISEVGRFSLTDLYLRLARTHNISGYLEDGNVWKDVGRMTSDK